MWFLPRAVLGFVLAAGLVVAAGSAPAVATPRPSGYPDGPAAPVGSGVLGAGPGGLAVVPAGPAGGRGPGADPDPGAAADLTRYLRQRPVWGPCAGFARTAVDREVFADARFDCAYLEVPLDYARPTARTVRIALLRQRALDPAARIGALFTDPGGPGGSGVGFLPRLAAGIGDGELARRFDLIGFDPRGVGVSEPAIDCSTGAEVDAERADLDLDTSPAGVAQTEAEERDFARRCAERVGLDVLANVGTRDVARDLRIAYRVLGEPKLTYLGYSYGTRIGTEFAVRFPAEVRAMVLDGAIDPAQDPVEARLTQSRGFQRAFNGFAADCATRPDCPLGTDPAVASAGLQRLLRPLIDAPVPAGPGRTLGYNDGLLGVITAMYARAAWERLRAGLSGLAAGEGTGLLRLADAYYQRTPDGHYSNLLEAFLAIGCADTDPVTDRALAREISRRSLALAPFTDAGYGPSEALEQCAFWPVPPTGRPGPASAPGLPTVLVVSSTGDPATPYEDGVSLAGQLAARLLTVRNDGHTVALQGANRCVDEIAVRYLSELVLPPADLTCERDPAPPAPR